MMWPRTCRGIAVAVGIAALGLMGACETTDPAPQEVRGIGTGSPTFLRSAPERAQPVAEQPRQEQPQAPAPRPAPRVTGDCNYSPDAGPNQSVVGLAFPTGDINSSALVLHQVMPNEVRRGQEFGYEYHVTNITRGTLQNVAVTLESRSNLNVISAQPSSMSGPDGSTVWSIGDLGPCETRVINVTAVANEVGQAANCVSVSYNNALCATTNVVSPDLAIEKTVTPRVLRCDPITITYNVCNPGTGVAQGVVVRDQLPAGLTVNGSRSVEIPVGDLASGECREVSVTAMASSTGEFCSPATARSSDGLSANSQQPCTVVVAPQLELVCTSRESQYINRNADFEFTVTNNGDGVAANTVVNVSLPAGSEFVRASQGGTPTAGGVTFNVGDLPPGASRDVTVTLVSRVGGPVRVSANANAACADQVQETCVTEFRGIPAILLEVVDLVDPVEVGQETTYVIRVTNQGSAPDTDVVVRCVLPDEMTYVSGTGATPATVEGQIVTFGTERVLEPREVVEWRLTVRAVGEGDVRFAVEMVSREFASPPIRETESTNLYE